MNVKNVKMWMRKCGKVIAKLRKCGKVEMLKYNIWKWKKWKWKIICLNQYSSWFILIDAAFKSVIIVSGVY